MLSKIPFWTLLIGGVVTLPLMQIMPQGSYASITAKSAVEIAETARKITVLITEPNSQGSGVMLQHQGDIYTILTAAHVVRSKVSYKITTPDERQYEAISSSVKSAPGNIDLAIVKFSSKANYPTAKLGNCNLVRRGMELYVAGFPSLDRAITTSILVVREGKVSANSNKTFDRGYSLIYSNDTLPGMSGGAVLNTNGELVAIHGEGDRDEDGRKNGFNLGIPIERFGTVASQMGVKINGQVAAISQDTAPTADDDYALGVQKDRNGDYRGALTDYNRAIAIDPNYVAAYTNRGNLKAYRIRDIRGALADYNRAIAIDPNYVTTYNSRSLLKWLVLKDIRGALADYNRAIAIDPSYPNSYASRGLLKADKFNDPQGALADFNRAIASAPTAAAAYAGRGIVKYQLLNDIPGAIKDVKQAARLFQQQGRTKDYQTAVGLLKKWQRSRVNER